MGKVKCDSRSGKQENDQWPCFPSPLPPSPLPSLALPPSPLSFLACSLHWAPFLLNSRAESGVTSAGPSLWRLRIKWYWGWKAKALELEQVLVFVGRNEKSHLEPSLRGARSMPLSRKWISLWDLLKEQMFTKEATDFCSRRIQCQRQ